MSRAKNTGKVSEILLKAIDGEVEEVARKYKDGDTIPAGKKSGDFVYDTLERMRVYDRAIKVEAIKLKVDDAGFGSNFQK